MSRELVTGAVVLILALAVAAIVVIYGLFVLVHGKALEPPASTTLATAVGGIIGVLGAYVGSQRRPPTDGPRA